MDLVQRELLQNPFIRHHVLSGDRSPLRPEDRDPAYLYEMRANARDAWKLAGEATREQLEADEVLQDALCYVLVKLGRFAGKVSPSFRAAHPEVPWERLAPREEWISRPNIDVDLLWGALRDDLPGLADKLDRLVPPLPRTASDEPEAAADTV